MKKDIEWLKEEIKNAGLLKGMTRKEYVLNLINQLEVKTLSPEWIDEHKFEVDNWNNAVHVEDLQNLLVPKQELPVIPKFVAYVIEAYKSNSSLTNLLSDLAFHGGLAEFVEHEDEDEVFEWARSNRKATDEILARAWLDGYTVEEEKKYYVRLGEKMYFAGWYEADATFVFDDNPSSLERAKTYNLKDGKEKIKELGTGELVKVEEL